MNTENSKHHYDMAIIGGGLCGLILGVGFRRKGLNVIILDKNDSLGGYSQKLGVGHVIPLTNQNQELVNWFEKFLGCSLGQKEKEAAIEVLEGSKKLPYIGFGGNNPEFYEEISYYLSPEILTFDLSPPNWSLKLIENFDGEFRSKSLVTKIYSDNQRIKNIEINGTTKLHAHHYVYCGTTHNLTNLIPDSLWNVKGRQKIAKTNKWTLVSVEINSKKQFPEQTYLLKSKDEEITLGWFYALNSSSTPNEQWSQWLTWIPSDETENEEMSALAIRKIRKLLKKSFPNIENNIIFEKISLFPQSHYSVTYDPSPKKWISLENLTIGCRELHPLKNIPAILSQAKEILEAKI